MTPSTKPLTAKMMPQAKHAVRIDVNGGKLGYVDAVTGGTAATLRVRKGDFIHWQCAAGNFAVLFKATSPFAEVGVCGPKGGATRDTLVTGMKGSYKYAVMVISAAGHAIVDDPEVIVDDGE